MIRKAETAGKDGPLTHTATAALVYSGVVLRHRAAASVCFTLDATAAVIYRTPEGAAQIRPAYNHILPNSRGFIKRFYNMVLYNCGLPFVLTV